jgi:hypothetical protein
MAIFGAAENSRNQKSYSGSPNNSGIRGAEKTTYNYFKEEKEKAYPTSDEIYIEEQGNRVIKSKSNLTSNKDKRREKIRPVDNFDEERATGGTVRQLKKVSTSLAISAVSKSTNLALKIKGRVAVMRIVSMVAPVYFIQLFFAVLSLVAFAVSAGISSVIESSYILSAAEKAASFFGYDAESLGISGGLFMLMYGLSLIFGIISISFALLLCTISGLKPISGEKSGLKQGMVILSVIGYSLPLFNIIPWFGLLLLAIWKYPR